MAFHVRPLLGRDAFRTRMGTVAIPSLHAGPILPAVPGKRNSEGRKTEGRLGGVFSFSVCAREDQLIS